MQKHQEIKEIKKIQEDEKIKNMILERGLFFGEDHLLSKDE